MHTVNINGFTPEEYKKYLSTGKESYRESFGLVMRRIAYAITHPLMYPNNKNLLKKIKEYQLTFLDDKTKQAIKTIVDTFKRSNFTQEELKVLKYQEKMVEVIELEKNVDAIISGNIIGITLDECWTKFCKLAVYFKGFSTTWRLKEKIEKEREIIQLKQVDFNLITVHELVKYNNVFYHLSSSLVENSKNLAEVEKELLQAKKRLLLDPVEELNKANFDEITLDQYLTYSSFHDVLSSPEIEIDSKFMLKIKNGLEDARKRLDNQIEESKKLKSKPQSNSLRKKQQVKSSPKIAESTIPLENLARQQSYFDRLALATNKLSILDKSASKRISVQISPTQIDEQQEEKNSSLQKPDAVALDHFAPREAVNEKTIIPTLKELEIIERQLLTKDLLKSFKLYQEKLRQRLTRFSHTPTFIIESNTLKRELPLILDLAKKWEKFDFSADLEWKEKEAMVSQVKYTFEQFNMIQEAVQAVIKTSPDNQEFITYGRQLNLLLESVQLAINDKYHFTAKSWMETIYNSSVGVVLNESNKPEDIKWKVDRYEEFINRFKENVSEVLCESGFLKEGQALHEVKKYPPQMEKLIRLNQLQLRTGNRYTQTYLHGVRTLYLDMMKEMRGNSEWASKEENVKNFQVLPINKLNHLFYTKNNFNPLMQEIANTFINLGNKKSEILIEIPKELDQALQAIYLLIESVGRGAKIPALKQIGHSLVGFFDGFLGLPFDPNMQSNVAHTLYKKIIVRNDEEKSILNIAMGTPTIGKKSVSGGYEPSVVPEFLGFLRHYKSEGKKHIYFNHQDMRKLPSTKENERVRCELLHNLAAGKEFEKTFYAVTFSQNSPFYEQEHKHLPENLSYGSTETYIIKESRKWFAQVVKNNSAFNFDGTLQTIINEQKPFLNLNVDQFRTEDGQKEFIRLVNNQLILELKNQKIEFPYSPYSSIEAFHDELVRQMFDDPTGELTGNCVPQEVRDACKENGVDLKEWSKTACKALQKHLFSGQILTVSERKVFIRLFYAALEEKILLELDPDSYNNSCKDRIDRGVASDAEDFYYWTLQADKQDAPEFRELFNGFVFARALLVRKRNLIKHRLDRLCETIKYLSTRRENLIGFQKELFGDNLKITLDVLQKIN